eukprot:TRINITY_DN1110_c0_g1_i1.p1 TRINITY_DN1110_c0_g1~~TRINITY_DN1110_c0_g1_i1.p1  ORF type:complete len:241 (+),score=48.58 TRINITY_DN1110_c0_g1_i1:1338-2060(+)
MGGLFARFCIGVLYQHNLFDWVECVNYVSIATPHSGVGSILPVFDVYENYMKPFFTGYAMSRSGSHLTLVDDDGKIGELRVPLLYAISCDGTCYMEGLKKFQKRILVSNFCNDMAVNYEGSSLVLKNDAHSSLDFDERSDFKILYFPLPSNSFQPLSTGSFFFIFFRRVLPPFYPIFSYFPLTSSPLHPLLSFFLHHLSIPLWSQIFLDSYWCVCFYDVALPFCFQMEYLLMLFWQSEKI